MNIELNTDELQDLLEIYLGYIAKFTIALQTKLQITDNPIHYTNYKGLIPKRGELVINNEQLTYHYHGAGCTLEWNGVSIGYDVFPKDNIIISPFKFERFLSTYLQLEPNAISTHVSEKYLDNLVSHRSLYRIDYPNGQYIYCTDPNTTY